MNNSFGDAFKSLSYLIVDMSIETLSFTHDTKE